MSRLKWPACVPQHGEDATEDGTPMCRGSEHSASPRIPSPPDRNWTAPGLPRRATRASSSRSRGWRRQGRSRYGGGMDASPACRTPSVIRAGRAALQDRSRYRVQRRTTSRRSASSTRCRSRMAPGLLRVAARRRPPVHHRRQFANAIGAAPTRRPFASFGSAGIPGAFRSCASADRRCRPAVAIIVNQSRAAARPVGLRSNRVGR